MKCITHAWDRYENELRGFLYNQLKDQHLSQDLLQDVFVKALTQREQFCELENVRAWLFRVTRNRLIDYYRTHKRHAEIPDNLPEAVPSTEPVVNLSKCLPKALQNLNTEDREIIELCDLEGLNQAEYAEHKHLSVAGAKSRIQRARKRLKEELHSACNIIFDEHGNVCCFDPECK